MFTSFLKSMDLSEMVSSVDHLFKVKWHVCLPNDAAKWKLHLNFWHLRFPESHGYFSY